MKGLTDIEKKIRKHIAKLLPDAGVDISYHRHVSWLRHSIASIAGLRPYVSNTMTLSLRISHEHNETENFNWEGKKLSDAMKKLEEWVANRERLKLAPIGLPAPKPELPLLTPTSIEEDE